MKSIYAAITALLASLNVTISAPGSRLHIESIVPPDQSIKKHQLAKFMQPIYIYWRGEGYFGSFRKSANYIIILATNRLPFSRKCHWPQWPFLSVFRFKILPIRLKALCTVHVKNRQVKMSKATFINID